MGQVIDVLTERNFEGTTVSEELRNGDTGGAQKVRVATWQRNKNQGIVAKRQHLADLLF